MSVESDNLAKQCLADLPGADNAMARYLLANLPKWIRCSFSRLTPQDIDDLTALLAAHITARVFMFKGDSSFDTWARQITRNQGRDWLRARALRWKREISIDAENSETGGSLANILPAHIRNPREELDLKEVRELIMKAIGKVRNSRYKLILEESFVSGLDIETIARLRDEDDLPKLYRDKCRALKALFKLVKEMSPGYRLEEYSPRLRRRY
jgi:RNA polymerase sigma factor (sigma-70 family)